MSKLREIAVDLAEKGQYEEASNMLKEAIQQGDFSAMNDLGVIAERQGDYEKALHFYQMMAMLGDPTALCNVGNMYEYGMGVEENSSIASLLYEKATKEHYPRAYFKLAALYQHGKGVDKDEKKAFELVLNGAKYENADNEGGCNVMVGYYYVNGIGVETDELAALKYYKKAIKYGNAVAMYNTALVYLTSDVVEQNPKKAIKLLEMAREKKYVDAITLLAKIYRDGEIVKKNYAVSDFYLLEAFDIGSPRACIMMAEIQLKGDTKEQQPNPDFAQKLIALLNREFREELDDYSGYYEEVKEQFKDAFDWDDVEQNPNYYLPNNNEVDERVC